LIRFLLITLLPFISVQARDTTSTRTTASPDTIDPLTHYFYKHNRSRLIPIDTSLQSVDITDPLDEGAPASSTGNFGAPHFPLIFQPDHSSSFQLGYDQYERYRFTSDSLKHFVPYKPYSRVNFGVGLKKELLVNVDYGQQLFENFFLSVEYRRMRADGSFQRQTTLNNNGGIGIRYSTPNERYHVMLDFIYNHQRIQENGGMAVEDVYGQAGGVSNELVSVKLDESENNYRDKGWHLQHSYDLGIEYGRQTDTTATAHFQPTWRLTHEAGFHDYRINYKDFAPRSSLDYYRDVGITRPGDTILQDQIGLARTMQKITNDVTLAYLGIKSADTNAVNYNNVKFLLSAGHRYYEIHRQPANKIFQTVQLSGQLQSHHKRQSPFRYKVEGDINLGGYPNHNFAIRAKGGYDWGKAGIFDLMGRYSSKRPPLLARSFRFRNLSWQLGLRPINTSSGGLRYQLPQFDLKLTAWYHRIQNHLYWNENFRPAQTDGLTDAIVLHLEKDFTWGKFHFDNNIYFQAFSDPGLFRMPKLYTQNRFYFQTHLFQKALFGRAGLDFSYRTESKGKYYMPVTGQFYHTDEKLTYYPTVDVFISFKVETARIYLRLDHANQGFPDAGFFNLADYPTRGRTFRGGVSWRFLN